MAGGPSPFGGEGFSALASGRAGAGDSPGAASAVDVVFAVDASASMSWGGRIDMIRGALKEWVAA